MKRATSILLRAAAWSAAALVGIALPMTQAVADHPPSPVGVHDDPEGAEYTPTVIEIYKGDTLYWVWDDANVEHHTVTSAALEPVFDSDDPCEESGRLGRCRKAGATYSYQFTETGEYDYYCKVHGTALGGPWGRVVVKVRRAHPSPSPSPSDSPSGSETETGSESPSEEPSGDPSSEPTEPSEEPTEDETSEETPEPTATSSSAGPSAGPSASASPSPSPSTYRPTRVGGDVPGGVVFEPAPEQVYTPGGTEAPNVAPPEERESEASPFPTAPEFDDPSDLAVNLPVDGRGPSRPLLAGIAVGGVLLTFGAFSKLVLFAPPWA